MCVCVCVCVHVWVSGWVWVESIGRVQQIIVTDPIGFVDVDPRRVYEQRYDGQVAFSSRQDAGCRTAVHVLRHKGKRCRGRETESG